MQWQLAHFGLELGSEVDYIHQSSVKCYRQLNKKNSSDSNYTVRDDRLRAPRTDEAMRSTFGHIRLNIPIIRPECLDQIGEIVPDVEPMGKMKKLGFVSKEDANKRISPQRMLDLVNYHTQGRYIIIHGNPFMEHNVNTAAEEMFLKVLPVPSLAVCGRGHGPAPLTDLRIKLDKIVYWNNILGSVFNGEKYDYDDFLSHIDVIDILTYHVYTYLDNAIPGIDSDPDLKRGIAQIIGTNIENTDFVDRNKIDIAGTDLQRIVRGINIGEVALMIEEYNSNDTSENLAFELSKQVAFNRIWKKSKSETNVIHIDKLGEINRMQNGTIDDFSWNSWDSSNKIPRESVVAPRFSKRKPIFDLEHPELTANLNKIKQIDSQYTISVQSHRALAYLFSLIDDFSLKEQQVIVCDVDIDEIILRPLLKKLKVQNESGNNICLLMTRKWVDNFGKYRYKTTPDEYRNVIIAITEIRERQSFAHKDEMFKHIKESTLITLSRLFVGFNRDEIVRILGSSIIAKGRLNEEYIQDYVLQILKDKNQSSEHIRPRRHRIHRKLTLEEIYSVANRRFVEIMEEESGKNQKEFDVKSLFNFEIQGDASQKKSLYDSLKGMDPLIHWVQNKGRLFSPAAKEFGFKEYPRGLLLTGVPGCGKTMAAKIIADEWDMNLRRVKVDDIISRFVGQNEENMSNLLKELEENEPIICFVDEAEKLFTEMNTNHQNHATLSQNAVESMLLQFMEENDKRVFFIFTANDITKLSAPIIDRFDACFFVDLPTKEARSEIIQLMLEERKKGNLGLNYDALAEKSEKFTGRDIRSAIEESMMNAFSEDRELTQEDLEDVFEKAISTSDTHADRITHLRQLVKEGKIRSANTDYKTKAAPKARFDPNVA